MDVSKLSDVELKALAFEEITKRDTATNNLNIILGELQERKLRADEALSKALELQNRQKKLKK